MKKIFLLMFFWLVVNGFAERTETEKIIINNDLEVASNGVFKSIEITGGDMDGGGGRIINFQYIRATPPDTNSNVYFAFNSPDGGQSWYFYQLKTIYPDAAGTFGLYNSKIPKHVIRVYTNLPFQIQLYDNIWVSSNCSALTYTDRTPYPETKEQAIIAIKSLERKTNDVTQLDHSKLDPMLQANQDAKQEDGKITIEQGRNLSMTVSCLAEVVKHLLEEIDKLKARVDKLENK